MIQDFQIENPSVPSDCIVQLVIPLKNRYSCLKAGKYSEVVQYTKCDGMWKKIHGQATQFSIPHLRQSQLPPFKVLGILASYWKICYYGTSEKKNWKTLQHAGWQKLLQEMVINLIHIPSNSLSLFTVFSQCLWHRALRKKRVTTPNSSTNIQEVKL